MRGLLPAKYDWLCSQLSAAIYQQILNGRAALEQEVTSAERIASLLPFIEAQIDEFLRVKLPTSMPMIAMLIGDKTIHQIKEVFVGEIKELFPKILRQYLEKLMTDGQLEAAIHRQLTTTAAKAYVLGLQQRCRPLFLKVKVFALLFGLLFGFLASLF